MKMIFVGSIYPKYLLEYLLISKVNVSFAANNYQLALIEGFSSYFKEIIIISSPKIINPRRCESGMLKPRVITPGEYGCNDFYYLGNIRYSRLRLISELFRTRKCLKRVLDANKEGNIVCCYSLHSPFLLAILSLKKHINKVCVVVPDLPEYMSSKGNSLHEIAKKIDRKIINFCIRRLDCFALLSEAMTERLPLKDKPWSLVEGIYKSQEMSIVEKSKNKSILYTGQLQRRYGLFDLVEAFMLIPRDDYELWLCGKGNADENKWFESRANEDSRIKLFGEISPSEVHVLQKRATLLVNPRHSNEVYTRFSFPSKTMEYLASGTPTLMCKLESIPEEYHQHLFFFDDESVVGMSKKMFEICEMDTAILQDKGNNASVFIKTQKNAQEQVRKIVNMF